MAVFDLIRLAAGQADEVASIVPCYSSSQFLYLPAAISRLKKYRQLS